MGLVVTFGMVVGAHLDDGLRGFKRSMTIIFPFIVMVLVTTLSRLYSVSLITPITSQAYNGTVTFVLSSLMYILGLFGGHSITMRAKKVAQRNI